MAKLGPSGILLLCRNSTETLINKNCGFGCEAVLLHRVATLRTFVGSDLALWGREGANTFISSILSLEQFKLHAVRLQMLQAIRSCRLVMTRMKTESRRRPGFMALHSSAKSPRP
eukprot:1156641-Pelagomonas_calceolata.AAC.2